MSQSYKHIPLRLLLNQAHFAQAFEIYITCISMDLYFAELFLSKLNPHVKLRLAIQSIDPEVIHYVNSLKNIAPPFFDIQRERYTFKNEILIKTLDDSFIITTHSELTEEGLKDDFYSDHGFSTDPDEYIERKKRFVTNYFVTAFKWHLDSRKKKT
jgi:hypothetical protein